MSDQLSQDFLINKGAGVQRGIWEMFITGGRFYIFLEDSEVSRDFVAEDFGKESAKLG